MAIKTLIDAVDPDRALTAGEDTVNNEGLPSFTITAQAQLARFIVIGTEGGSFYEKAQALTSQTIASLAELTASDPALVVSLARRYGLVAPKRSYALFALAFVHAKAPADFSRTSIDEALVALVRTGTDLLEFVSYASAMRSFGRSMRRTLTAVLDAQDADRLALWAIKYRQREGWTWQDFIRQTHISGDADHNRVYRYMAKPSTATAFGLIAEYEALKGATPDQAFAMLKTGRLPWEAFSDEQRTDAFWAEMAKTLKGTALIRNLAQMTRRGVLAPGTRLTADVADRVAATGYHPVKALEAMKVYASGGAFGRSTAESFSPVAMIVDALEECAKANFSKGPSTGTRFSINLDVSGSMTTKASTGSILMAAEAGAGMTLAIKLAERNCVVNRFDGRFEQDVRIGTTFDQAYSALFRGAFGTTDCALPFERALADRQEFDTFVVITDNETNASRRSPAAALAEYRRKVNPKARLIVLACSLSKFSIADPKDPGMLDIPGFSSDVVDVVQAFASI